MADKNKRDRLEAALRGAFAGSPTPLKDIPKKNGESRMGAKEKEGPNTVKNAVKQKP